jgi:hypothetical protein
MSEYVVHFTKDNGARPPLPQNASDRTRFYRRIEGDRRSPYWNMLAILYEGHLKPGHKRSFGSARHLAWLGDMNHAVCFSEVPFTYLRRITNRYSQYGIAFKQKFLAARLGARVWYLDVGSIHEKVWLDLLANHEARRDPNDNFWGLATCVDRAGYHGGTRYEFEWEREWRIPGPVGLEFTPDDVGFLFLPSELHDAARRFFESAVADNRGPGYFCPYIDARWAPDRIEAALAVLPPS